MGARSCFLVLSLLAAVSACSGYRSTVLPRLAITGEYTDNIGQDETNPQSDVINTVSPGVTYSLTGATRGLTLSYDPSLAYHAEREESFSTRHAATLNAYDQMTRASRFELRDSFTLTDDPTPTRDPTFQRTDEPAPTEDTTIRRGTEPYYTNFANARFLHRFGPTDLLFLAYTHSMLQNEDPNLEDNTRHIPEAGVTYYFNPRYGIEANARYSRGDFSGEGETVSDSINELYMRSRLIRRFSPRLGLFVQYALTRMAFEGNDPDYQVHDVSVGFDYNPSETVSVSMGGGYFYRTIDDGDPTGGYVVRGDMAKRFARGAVRLSGGIGYDQAFYGAENLGFTEFREILVAGTYEFTRTLSGEVSASYRNSSYTDVADREDTVAAFLAGLNYRLRPWLLASLRYVHRTVDSNQVGGGYDENRVSLSLTMVPATPFILNR